MEVAIICDTHIGVRNDSYFFHDNFEKSMSWFFDIIDAAKIKHVIHLGDLFDRRKYLNFNTARICRQKFLEPLDGRGIETHILAGNHDEYYKNTHTTNALDEIITGRYKNIYTYTTPEVVDIGGKDIQLIPWITESNIKESLNAIKTSRANTLMGHLEIQGFEMHKGSFCVDGMSREIFTRYDRCFSGHLHHNSTRDNITYLGAFSEFTWSDFGDHRGFSIFNTETELLTKYPNKNTMFKMIIYDDERNPNIVEELVSSDYSNCYVKIVCMKRTNTLLWDALLDKIYKAKPIDISVVENINVFKDNEEGVVIDQAEDTPKILSSYISGLTLPADIDNDKAYQYLLGVYQEAINLDT
jgi:DNA repair exonuclease SbcCD nuclease subunit